MCVLNITRRDLLPSELYYNYCMGFVAHLSFATTSRDDSCASSVGAHLSWSNN
jgi:hypothetical protein